MAGIFCHRIFGINLSKLKIRRCHCSFLYTGIRLVASLYMDGKPGWSNTESYPH